MAKIYLLPDLNRYSVNRNQILSLTCLPIPPNKHIKLIPQFDLLSLGAQVFGLLVSFSIFYYFNIEKTIPLFAETKKFRIKKLQLSSNKLDLIDSNLEMIKTEDSNNYKKFI